MRLSRRPSPYAYDATGVPTSCTDAPSYALRPLLDTLKVQQNDLGAMMTLNALVEPSPTQQQLPAHNLSLTMMQLGTETTTAVVPQSSAVAERSSALVENIELTKGQVLTLDNEGKAEGSLTVEPIVTRNKSIKADLRLSRAATEGFVRAAGGIRAPEKFRVAEVRHLSLASKARYIPTRGGKAEPEEESEVAEHLNRLLDEHNLQLFASLSKPPITIKWDYRGINCGSADAVDCDHGIEEQVQRMKPPSDEERVHPKHIYADVTYPDDPTKTSIDIYFPTFDEKRVYRVTITATATDNVSGNKDTYTFEYWNAEQPIPGIGDKAIQWVVRYAAGAAGVSPDMARACQLGPTTDLLVDLKSDKHRRCALLRGFAASVVQQGTIEVPELRRMIDAFRILQRNSGS